MNRITTAFKRLQETGRKAFIPFITAGYPDLQRTPGIFAALERAGADIIELGMPFSDPLADGPTIQTSSHEAIAGGATPAAVFSCIESIRQSSELPVILFTYSNLLFKHGIDGFMQSLADAGGDGLLIPDLPVEESKEFHRQARKHNIRMIFLVSPLTQVERMKEIERISDDFVYCVAVAGVTGARRHAIEALRPYLSDARRAISKPFVVGFGVGSPEDAHAIAGHSDGVVVGSALIRIIEKYRNSPQLEKEIEEFAGQLRKSI